MSFHFEDPSDVKGFYDPALLETTGEDFAERVQELEKKVFLLGLKVESNKTSEMLYALKIAELEEDVERLSRTLDLLQEVLGVEVVVEDLEITITFEADEG